MTTRHLDDETLSSLLDGESAPGAREHLADCPACQGRLAQLRVVAQMVAAPVPERAHDETEAAIAKAMAIVPFETAVTPPRPMPQVAAVATSGHRRPGPPGGVATDDRSSPATWRRRAVVGAGSVAAAILVVGAIVVVQRSTSGGTAHSASGPAATSPAPALGGAPTNPAKGTTSATLPTLDLGAQSDPGVVARLLAPALAAHAPASVAPAVPAAAASSGVAPLAGAANGASGIAPPAPALLPETCIQRARSALGLPVGSPLVLQAALQWRGQASAAIVFDRPGGRAGAVVSVPGCGVLAVLPI